LLIEEARTNNLVYSEQFDNALWNKTDTTITANSIIAPSGALTAELATEGSAGSSNVAQAITIVANSTNTFSVFLKRGNTDWIRFVIWDSANNANRISAWVNLSTGALGASVVNAGTSTGGVATTTNYGNGWYRVTLSGAVNNAAVLLNCLFSSAASDGVVTRVSGATYYAWGAQTESGAFVTSYIPTVASTVTRTADAASMTGTNFSNWFNDSIGTFVIALATMQTRGTTDSVIFELFNNSAKNNRRGNFINAATGNLVWRVANNAGTIVDVNVNAAATVNASKTACAWSNALTFIGESINASAVATSSSAVTPTSIDTLNIGRGRNDNAFVNQIISRVFFYPQTLINAELQAFSK
jgi:hypothetical protein